MHKPVAGTDGNARLRYLRRGWRRALDSCAGRIKTCGATTEIQAGCWTRTETSWRRIS